MAIDVHLQIDGIKGESADSKHQGWIEVSSAQWGVVQPMIAPGSAAGGRTTGRSEYHTLSIVKHIDLASPVLMQTCSSARPFPRRRWNSCGPMATETG